MATTMTMEKVNSLVLHDHSEASMLGLGSESHSNLEDEEDGLPNLPSTSYLCQPRHEMGELSVSGASADVGMVHQWRMKERMKTGSVALVLCLNIGVDPPDVIKLSPCGRMECWIDPDPKAPQRTLRMIGEKLHEQYACWQPKAHYRQELDPTVEHVRRLCVACRRHTNRNERVLFHYNGHGVPKPTENGEIWLFNQNFTQYIPLSVYELETWLETPSIYVFDCSAAGMILRALCSPERADMVTPRPQDFILLAACGADETLPQSPQLPADVFTACLTTPVKVALKWFCPRSLLRLDPEIVDKIPGRQPDRKTPLGELNWIFTAITDTIAWNVLPKELFQKLFRQDLLVASLFRNFLLAERIMRGYNCTPCSYPQLPPTHHHHMWRAWDLAAETCLEQIPALLNDPSAEFQPSRFFSEQLTAFEVWLEHGSEHKRPPEQLPIVLQVLLSQSHRYKALRLLGNFLDMGAWAVDLALSVGIFPYVLKLLQTIAPELRWVLVFIWTKILALDKSCQVDLVKDGGHMYFLKFLDNREYSKEDRAMAAFVLTVIVDSHPRGQKECLQAKPSLQTVAIEHLHELSAGEAPLLARWLCICLSKLWDGEGSADAQKAALTNPLCVASLLHLLTDPQPEVRAAAAAALGSLIYVSPGPSASSGSPTDPGIATIPEDVDARTAMEEDVILRHERERDMVFNLLCVANSVSSTLANESSPLVRMEICIVLSRLAWSHKANMAKAAERSRQSLSTFFSKASSCAASCSARAVPAGLHPFAPISSMIPRMVGSAGSGTRPSSMDSSSMASVLVSPGIHAGGASPVTAVNRTGRMASGSAPDHNHRVVSSALMVTSPVSPAGFPCAEEGGDDSEEDGSEKATSERDKSSEYSIDREGTQHSSAQSSWPMDSDRTREGTQHSGEDLVEDYMAFTDALLMLSRDPYPRIAEVAHKILSHLGVDVSSILRSTSDLSSTPILPHTLSTEALRPSAVSTVPRGVPVTSITMLGRDPINNTLPRSNSWREGFSAPWMTPSPPRTTLIPSVTSPVPSGLRRSGSTGFLSPTVAAAMQDASRSAAAMPLSVLGADPISASPTRDHMEARHSHHQRSESLGVGMGAGSVPASASAAESQASNTPYLPKSNLYNWSRSHFSKPCQQGEDIDEDKLELREQRYRDMLKAIHMCQHRNVSKVSNQVCQIDTSSNHGTQALLLHPFESVVCIADTKETIRVWSHDEESPMMNEFDNVGGREKPGHVCRMCWVNELDDTLLLVASADGSVRVWRNFMSKGSTQLVTAWQAGGAVNAKRSVRTGCVADWQQLRGHLYASGPIGKVLVWDLEREYCVAQVAQAQTDSPAAVTQLSASQVHPAKVAAAFSDGSIRIFDMRARGLVEASLRAVENMAAHDRIEAVDFQPGADFQKLVSASASGEVCYMDLRSSNRARNMVYKRVDIQGTLTAMAVHRHAPVLATGSQKQFIKVYDMDGQELSMVRYYNSFLGQKIGPVKCLQFHPLSILLAAGATDAIVSMYQETIML